MMDHRLIAKKGFLCLLPCHSPDSGCDIVTKANEGPYLNGLYFASSSWDEHNSSALDIQSNASPTAHRCQPNDLAVVASHAALPAELYWNSVLPNTPMPKAVRDLLQSDMLEEKSTSVGVGNGGVNVDTGKGKTGGGTNVGVGKGGVSVDAGKGKKVKPAPSAFKYKYAATENQLHDNPDVALFFLEKDMHPSTKMNLDFTKSTNEATFLPRQVAKSIPFSSNRSPEILNQFSVKPGSMEAEIMKNTIKECEEPGIKGEDKFCATSAESMIDFSTYKLGKNVQAMSTEAGKETKMQKYTIAVGVKKVAGDESVVCHKQNYAYAVFYCHTTHTTSAYLVPLVGADGTKVEAVAVCHKDTSA
ncbi:hypothetical protein L1049_018958 [Liquidambar formosana]|uniref:BURP domain-containing protein n=1 Tax=Liquidambar formosana TaxID=63359 RepID=A0AAP0RAU5_LIQFO